ncbi:MAG: hypothetical protein IKL13_05865 [Clostridia bacterium]|nr:hypothetical protein [Clostridia bacterium]
MTELRDLKKRPLDNPIQTIFGIVVSITVLLLFMFLLRDVGNGVQNTLVNFISLTIAIIVLVNVTGLRNVVGEGVVLKVVLFALVVSIVSLVFSRYFVFNRYMEGAYGHLSHIEHDLMYNQMQIISTRLSTGNSLANAIQGLQLNQYHNIFVYSAMIFLVGGINLTNMIVWSALHMVICAVCMTLMCYRFGITDRARLNLILVLSLCQPLFWAVHHYNKVIIGQAFIMVAMYIYVCSFHNSWLNMLLFPVYAWLLWSMRLQYLLIAVVLCLMCIIVSNQKRHMIIVVQMIVVLAIAVLLIMSMDMSSFLQSDLNFASYTEDSDYSLLVMPMRLLRSFLPYFPFTNIFNDKHWAFNVFCILQITLNLVLWYLVLSRALVKRRLKKLFANPMFIAAVGFFCAGLLSAIHTTYVSVGTILLLSEIEDVKGSKIFINCVFTFMLLMFVSVVYFALGLTGSVSSGVVV